MSTEATHAPQTWTYKFFKCLALLQRAPRDTPHAKLSLQDDLPWPTDFTAAVSEVKALNYESPQQNTSRCLQLFAVDCATHQRKHQSIPCPQHRPRNAGRNKIHHRTGAACCSLSAPTFPVALQAGSSANHFKHCPHGEARAHLQAYFEAEQSLTSAHEDALQLPGRKIVASFSLGSVCSHDKKQV